MDIKKEYWKNLRLVYGRLQYLCVYNQHSKEIKTIIDVFIAFASSASIASWILWEKYAFLWSGIVVASQVINVIRPYLPFEKRYNICDPFILEVTLLYDSIENDWRNLNIKNYTDEKIVKLLNHQKNKYTSLENKYLSKYQLPNKIKYINEARKKTDEYLKNNF